MADSSKRPRLHRRPPKRDRALELETIDITGVSHDGAGVGRAGDMVIFVRGAVPGDKVQARITSVKKNLAYGDLHQIIEASPDRINASCTVADACGGCTFQGVRYEAQLRWKQRAVRDAVERIGGLRDVHIRQCTGAREPSNYRNKVQFPVALVGGKPVAGCYAKGTHDVIPTDDCGIQHKTNNLIVRECLALIRDLGLSVYDERQNTGLVRHIMGRVAPGTGESLAVIVTSTRGFVRGEEFARKMMARVPGLAGVVQNINTERTNIILGRETRVLIGRGYIDDLFGNDRLGRLRFRISALSFYQVNAAQAALLYEKAIEYADLKAGDVALDLYSGIGTITLFLARRSGMVIGVEEVPEAIKDARQNAKLNGIDNVEFVAGRAERVLPSVLGRLGTSPRAIVLDPPRKGCEPEVLQAVARARPERLVYISCYPPTLARDLSILEKNGFHTLEIQPVDLFPHTGHVECVVLMSRVEK